MNKKPTLLSTVEPWDRVAAGYAETTMNFFKVYAERALTLAELSEESSILDVACGPGTLSLQAASAVRSIQALDFSPSMIDLFRTRVNQEQYQNIAMQCGDGQNLPFEDASFDAAFSMFGLMFFPDRDRGYAEIYRTLKTGGRAVISSWAPVSDSPAMQLMFGALKTIKPDLPSPETNFNSLENPEFFARELQQAGFKEVKILPVIGEYPVEDHAIFWSNMVKGSAPIVEMRRNMSTEEWDEKQNMALNYIVKQIPNLPSVLTTKAWLGFGIK